MLRNRYFTDRKHNIIYNAGTLIKLILVDINISLHTQTVKL